MCIGTTTIAYFEGAIILYTKHLRLFSDVFWLIHKPMVAEFPYLELPVCLFGALLSIPINVLQTYYASLVVACAFVYINSMSVNITNVLELW